MLFSIGPNVTYSRPGKDELWCLVKVDIAVCSACRSKGQVKLDCWGSEVTSGDLWAQEHYNW